MRENLLRLSAQLAPTDNPEPGTVRVRLVPYGETIEHQGLTLNFSQGDISLGDGLVPVNLEHDGHVLSRVGKATRMVDSDDAMYAELAISDTGPGRDILTLMRDGVVTDVSAGIALDMAELRKGRATGPLDHIAITAEGAFGEAGAGSKVLAAFTAHDEGGLPMGDEIETTAPVVDDNPQLVTLAREVDDLRTVVAELSVPGSITEPDPADTFSDLRDFVLTLHAASRGDSAAAAKMAEFALAGDTTTGAAGLVPDWHSRDIISVIAETRPYVATLPVDPIGDYGMTLVYPNVTQKPDVDVQATENAEVATQSFTVADASWDIDTFAGANLASRQVVERSAPSYVEAFFAEMAGIYAQRTEGAAVAAGVAGAGGSAILADLSADAAATWAAFATAAGTIAGAVRRPATDVVLATDRWTQLISLTDADGRPMVVFPEAGPSNAQGIGDLTTMVGVYGGLRIHHSPDAAAGTCLIYSRSRFQAVAEQNPVQLRAEVVSTLSWELGVYGLFVPDMVKYAGGGYKLTTA